MVVDDAVKKRQKDAAKRGKDWEDYVRNYLNGRLADSGIQVIPGGNQSAIKRRSRALWRSLSLAGKTGDQVIWGDIDLVAVEGDRPIAIISCKTSLHGRLTETLFYSVLFKARAGPRVVLATCDAGSGPEGALRSEWGTPSRPTKPRNLAEAFLDGVYFENAPSFTPPNIKTVSGGRVKDLSELPHDLKDWR